VNRVRDMTAFKTIPAGTILFHGTSSGDFDEDNDHLDGPAWLSDSEVVATRFAQRNHAPGEKARVLHFVLEEDVELHLITGQHDLEDLAEEFGIDFGGVEEMRDSVSYSGIPGWVIPNNYPEGADILLVRTGALRLEKSVPLKPPEPAPRRRMRP
jgi:hypothetical protein